MSASLFGVEKRIVVITGGLGQLGQQFSTALLESGARVAILDAAVGRIGLPDDIFRQFITEGRLLIIKTDVTRRSSLEAALADIRKEWKETPYGLINNAALDSPPDAPATETGPFEDFPEESWDRVMDVNVKGVFHACQVFGAEMATAGEGSIINIGSIYGLVSPDHRIYSYKLEETGIPFYKPAAYTVSKSALQGFTKYLAAYWGESGVRTNMMALGGVFNHQDEKFMVGYCAKVPLQRMAREDEYNGTVLYLLSKASSYMTGATLTLDGGWTAW